jgi:hypothetical protein
VTSIRYLIEPASRHVRLGLVFPAENQQAVTAKKEREMFARLLITSAFALLFTGPAFADCNQAVQDLKEMVTQAETGAGSAGSALPTSPHQEEVLPGKQSDTGATGQSAAGQSGMAASPHQQQVLAGGEAGQQTATLIAEASEMAEAGDEQGCMQKVNEAKGLLGSD